VLAFAIVVTMVTYVFLAMVTRTRHIFRSADISYVVYCLSHTLPYFESVAYFNITFCQSFMDPLKIYTIAAHTDLCNIVGKGAGGLRGG
jgi:hypothetical protein